MPLLSKCLKRRPSVHGAARHKNVPQPCHWSGIQKMILCHRRVQNGLVYADAWVVLDGHACLSRSEGRPWKILILLGIVKILASLSDAGLQRSSHHHGVLSFLLCDKRACLIFWRRRLLDDGMQGWLIQLCFWQLALPSLCLVAMFDAVHVVCQRSCSGSRRIQLQSALFSSLEGI